ncbi:cyclase family protein [Cryomorphaceae bacterium]|nr:cyclase family protein [Cryomorphaceae bacterium]
MLTYLSHVLDENTPSYGDRDRLKIAPKSTIVDGVGANTSTITFTNNHMGTHMDTPFHFCDNGKKTPEYSASELYFDKVALIDIPCEGAKLIQISDLDLRNVSNETDLLLIRTGYEKWRSNDKYHNDNPGLAPEIASYLREEFPNIRAVGFDFISLTSWKHREEGRLSHRAFLCGENPIVVLEDVALEGLTSEPEWAMVAPLRTIDGNGGPVTIIASV